MISPYVLSLSLRGCAAAVAIRNPCRETDSHIGLCPPRNDDVVVRSARTVREAGPYLENGLPRAQAPSQ